jgi:ankyrin repeat protein
LEEIDDQSWEYAHRLFQCVAVAPCPLRVEELAEFLAFDFNTGQIPSLLPNWRPEDPVGAVLSTCPSLFTVFDVDGDKIIQFSHFSVKEYLTSPRLVDSRDTISRFHVSMLPANAMVAKACLSVLLHIDETINRRSLQNFPLAEYAAEYLVDHARFEGVWPGIQDGMKQLFDSGRRHFSIWVWIYDPEYPWCGDDRSENPFPPKGTPLHYAAFYGLLDVVKLLVIERPQDVNALGFDYDGTPLFGASRNGHLEVARVLLENGADVKARDNKHRAPLHWASKRGRVEVVRILLEHGADAKVQDDRGRSPLHRASQHGHVEVARILLESDADQLAHDKKGRTSLHWASKRGHVAVARVLLSHGADVEAQDINTRTPLDRALERGHLDVARVLFEHGADTNTLEEKSQVPLHLTSRVGYHDLIWFLHQRRSKTNVRDEVRAPFQEASVEEHHSIMQLLFEDEIQTKEM